MRARNTYTERQTLDKERESEQRNEEKIREGINRKKKIHIERLKGRER